MVVNKISLSESLDLAGKKPWEFKHLDTMGMWNFGDEKRYISLNLLDHPFGITSGKSDTKVAWLTVSTTWKITQSDLPIL